MKRTILLILVGVALGASGVWLAMHNPPAETETAEADSPALNDKNAVTVTRDAEGNAVISLSRELQNQIGLVTTTPATAQLAPELKGFGQVMDPAPLAALMMELTTARSAYSASSNDLVRLKSLESQGNASARALQTAEAAAQRDAAAMQVINNRLSLSWGMALANQEDLAAFVQSLTALEKVLVRIDLPLGEKPDSVPKAARVETVSGQTTDAEFLGPALSVDPQMPGRGFLFLIPANTLHLLAGEAVTGYLKLAGELLDGVIVPRDAVIRTEGKGWAYVLNSAGDSFTRREIPFDHGVAGGWFVTNGWAADSRVIVVGAQTLLSQELKGSISAD